MANTFDFGSVFMASHEPSDAQLRAGNYPKRRLVFQGIPISIETPAGSVRRGIDPDGGAWETRMVFDYGYVRGSLGMDGDHVDVFIGPHQESPVVFLVDQRTPPGFDRVDEQKVMLGFASEEEARAAYLKHYDDVRFLGAIRAMPIAEFRAKVFSARGRMIKSSGVLDFGAAMLLKSEHGPIPAGAHWITVHPHGEGSKGQPILVMPQSDGSLRVIGGAGGALNHLKLRAVARGEGYKESIRRRQQERQQARKEQIAKDKELGIHEAKVAERAKLREEMANHRREFVKTVADLMGWQDYEFDEQKHAGLSPEALNKARREHERELFRRAKRAVDLNRKRLAEDHDARVAAGLGELPLRSESESELSLSDLAPMPETSKPALGFAPNYAQRAERHGVTSDVVQEAAVSLSGENKAETADQVGGDNTTTKLSDKVSAELEQFRLANPETPAPAPSVLEDAKKAAALVKAQKKLKIAEKLAKQASLELASATVVESKAHILEVSDAEVEEAARKQVEEDVRTIGAVGLLSEIGKMGGEESLGGHVATGAFNSLNAFSVSAGGEPLIDRSVVDVLGINAAAQVLARRIAKDYDTGEFERIRQGVEDYHVNTQHDIQSRAVAEARELANAAAAIELPEGNTGFDLAQAQELNHRRREAINQAKRVLGQATGELQATAALVMALREGARDSVEVPLGKSDAKAAITKLGALGLKPGDYELEDVDGNLVATIKGDGLDKLAKPVDVEGMRRVRRNLDIISGRMDEEGWLPNGFADRPDLAMHVEPGVAPKLAEPFSPGADLKQSLRDYIGGRVADGDAIADIVADVQSQPFFEKAGDVEAYRNALDEVVPLRDESGKLRPVESLEGRFQQYADEFVSSRYRTSRAPLHRQSFDVDEKSVDALHRALSATPEGVSAFKPVGELTHQERHALRKWWETNISRHDAGADDLKKQLAAHEEAEPPKEFTDIFGETSANPEWSAWKQKGDELKAQIRDKELSWSRYVQIMGSPEAAISAVQDLVRSRVVRGFVDAFNRLKPESALKIGRTPIRGALHHLDAVDPAAREARLAKQRELIDSLRERVQGKYASGSVADKIEAQKANQKALEQAQMSFFASDDLSQNVETELGADERYTIGHVAEQKLAGMMSVVGQNFQPGKPTKLWKASMSGAYIAQQRAIKLIDANGRVALAYGAGSGKTGICLGATTHLIETGKIKRALHLVPSIVQDQYNGEALRYLQPGRYKWHCKPGASREERIAAYKDPSNHFCVMTHEAFRSDMIYLGAQHAGISEKEMTKRLNAMTPDERKEWARGVMEKEGIDFGAVFVDEAHQIVNRAGKENSARANVIDAVTDNTPYYVYSSGDPIKNDASELHDVLSKLDRDRYKDRDAFMRTYGVDTVAAKAALKRELARYGISNTIAPPVKAVYENVHVPLTDAQRNELKRLDEIAARVRLARMSGKVDVSAARELSPSAFVGAPEDKHEEIARSIHDSLGIVKQSAIRRVLNSPSVGNAKIDKLLEIVSKHDGQPGVVFAHHKESVRQIVEALEKAGKRVAVITGEDSAVDKAKKKALFHPESGEPQADIMVMSDAGAVGMNLQRGRWLVQHDIPDTAMAQPLDANVLTPRGWVAMGDIKVGDLVVTPNGEVAPVSGVFPQGEKEIYRVTFSDGSSARCCMDHLWATKSRDDVAKGRGWRIRSLEHIARTMLHSEPNGTKRPVYSIPLVGRLDFADSVLPIPPYLLGALLGDGEFGREHVSLACVDNEILQRVTADVELMGGRVSKVGRITYRLIGDGSMYGFPAKRKSPVLHAVRALGLSKVTAADKFIPHEYLFGRRVDRIALLQGLMDTDGTVDKRTGSASFCSTSRHLISGVVHLAQSLGGVATVGSKKSSVYRGNTGLPHWKVTISLPNDINPFSLSRKAEHVDKRQLRYRMRRGIVSIEPCGVMPAQCILVDHPDHLYVTDGFIVTHNCHGQRAARIHRLGQTNDVHVYTLAADHKAERSALDRLQKKYQLRELMLDPMDSLDDSGMAGFINKRLAEKNQEALF